MGKRDGLVAAGLFGLVLSLGACGSGEPKAPVPPEPKPIASKPEPPPPEEEAAVADWQLRCGVDEDPSNVLGRLNLPGKNGQVGGLSERLAKPVAPRRGFGVLGDMPAPRRRPPRQPQVSFELKGAKFEGGGAASFQTPLVEDLFARCAVGAVASDVGPLRARVHFASSGVPTLAELTRREPMSPFERCMVEQLCSLELKHASAAKVLVDVEVKPKKP